MLRLPLPGSGITAGCNFAAVHVLLNVLSGLSRLMGPGPSNSGKHFKQFVRQRYPWHMEPRAGLLSRGGTDALYDRFRNGFSHDLGLSLESVLTSSKTNRVRQRFKIGAPHIGVNKEASLDPSRLVALDDVTIRPPWLHPTISKDKNRVLVVDAVALYWGVRRLIFDHTDSKAAVRSVHHMVDRSFRRRTKAGP